MANGMASLMVGATGIKSAQTALNTTAHNLANVNTVGYTRQQIAFKDTQYVRVGSGITSVVSSTYGLGVGVSEIRRIRDQFIDSAYRAENSRLGYYKSQYQAIEEIEDQFGEMQGVTYQESLTNLYNAINELSKEPLSTVKRSSLIQNASAFLTRSEAVYKGLTEYQQTLNVEVGNLVNRINEIGEEIYRLNKQVAKIESTGIESANDYRDQRDVLLDELSGYIPISYYEVENGEVMVTADSIPFVTTTTITEMSYRLSEGSELMIPTWPGFLRDVYDASSLTKVVNDNDKGELKGLLLARGMVEVDYTDIPVKPLKEDYDLTTTQGKADYDEAMALYKVQQEYYNTYVEPSAISCAIAGIDKLVNGIVTALNQVFCPHKEYVTTTALTDASGAELIPDKYTFNSTNAVLYTDEGIAVEGALLDSGDYYYESNEQLYTDNEGKNKAAVSEYHYNILDMDKTDYGMDEDKTVGEGLFKRTNTEDYVEVVINGVTQKVHNNMNSRGDLSLFTLGNLQINEAVAQDVSKIPMTTLQGKEDMAKGQELVEVWNDNFASLNPENYAVGNFNTFYNNYVSEFATVGRVLNNYVNHQTTMVQGYNDQRLQTEGVSSDEELEKMIKYQQAYNAASRYVNVISEMLEHLVTSLGSM